MKLIYIPGACSLAVHIALEKIGGPLELNAFDPATRKLSDGTDLSSISSKPYVPALVLSDGEVLTETSAILMSLDELYPAAELLPLDGAAKRRVREWLLYISTELHKTFAPLFGPELPLDQTNEIREKIALRFDYIAAQLSHSDYLIGEQPYVCDAYLFVMLLWANAKEISLDHWPSLASFQQRMSDLKDVKSAMVAEGLIPAAEAAALARG